MGKSVKREELERNIEELSCLYEVTKQLNAESDLTRSLKNVLEILSERMGMRRGAISILDPVTDEIRIRIGHDMTESAIRKGHYRVGEGVTGTVIKTGKPMVIPVVSKEPLFLDRTGARSHLDKSDISFICVPIKSAKRTVGALSADRLFDDKYSLDEDVRLLTIIATLVAEKVVSLENIHKEREALKSENLHLKNKLMERYDFKNIVGNSNKMHEVFEMIAQVAKSNATVLLRGESGTGKGLIAHCIHFNSLRAKGSFIKVNCAAIPATLIESELFGHEKGAFTGANQQKPGRFELAHKGTIFLDEIGSIDEAVQARLLRVLQEKEFERVGGIRTIKTDVRIVAATNRNLEEAVEQGEFREDLYYRLNVFPLYLPPLRERKTDVMLLADYFLEKYAKENQKDIRRISTSAIDMLMSYHWPGNVRELENCIERAVLLCQGNVIHSYHLPPSLQTSEASGTELGTSLESAMARFEKDMLMDSLKSTRGNMAKAARILKTTERKFVYKVKKHGIDLSVYKQKVMYG